MTTVPSERPPDTLRYSYGSAPTAVGLAGQLGWFERVFGPDGIAVESVGDCDDGAVREPSFRQGACMPAIWGRAEGRETRIIGIAVVQESQQILTLPRTEIRTVKDLRGRRLGLPRRKSGGARRLDVGRATALRGYVSSLASEGLSIGDVELVDLDHDDDPFVEIPVAARRPGRGYDEEVFALVRGEVDAVFVTGARGREVEADLEARRVIDLETDIALPLTVDGELARNHPDIVQRILAIAISAGEWAKDHPAHALAHLAQQVQSSELFSGRAYPDAHVRLTTDLTEPGIDALQQCATFMAEHGFVREKVDVRSWIDWAPGKALRARAASRPASRSLAHDRVARSRP